MLDKKALEAALKEHSLASHHELPPIRWLERAIEAYLAALPDEGELVKEMRSNATALRMPSRFNPVVPDNPEIARWLDDAADALEGAQAKSSIPKGWLAANP